MQNIYFVLKNMEEKNMDKKILALLIILIATVSVATVYASEELVSHDFGKFKMNIYDGQKVAESSGSVGQAMYNITNKDGSTAFNAVYYDTSNTGGNNNTTDFVLNTGYKNITNKKTNGNITTFDAGNGVDKVYCISSKDNTKVVVVIGADAKMQDIVSSVKF